MVGGEIWIVYNRSNLETQVGNAMCGIVGFLDKHEQMDFPIGRTLLTMLQALSCRGPDSAGVALFGGRGEMRLRLSVPPETDRQALNAALQEEGLEILRSYRTGVHDARIAAEVDW